MGGFALVPVTAAIGCGGDVGDEGTNAGDAFPREGTDTSVPDTFPREGYDTSVLDTFPREGPMMLETGASDGDADGDAGGDAGSDG